MLFRDLIEKMVTEYHDRIAFIENNETTHTFQAINLNSNAIANGLKGNGLLKGDKIVMLSRNSHYYRDIFWAAGKAGFVFIPINYRLHPDEIVQIVNNADAQCLIISNNYEEVANQIRDRLTGVTQYYSIDSDIQGYEYLGRLIQSSSKEVLSEKLTEDDLLYFQYTSGTTGVPKGAVYTQHKIAKWVEEGLRMHPKTEKNYRSLQFLPLYAAGGFMYDIMYQSSGTEVVLMSKFDASEVLTKIEKYKIKEMHIVPVILSFLLENPNFDKYDLSSLDLITYGGSPMAPDLLKKGIDNIGPIFMQDYGASESHVLTILPKEDHILDGNPEKRRRLSSCGKPVEGVDVKVLDEIGEEVKVGEIGELTVKSDLVMKEYWKMPQETKECLKDGRFYTGDLCIVDEDGYIYIKDRKKDMIISGGMNIYPFEVEMVLLEHPNILDAAVIGVPDEKWGEAICALIVYNKNKGAIPENEDIIQFVRERIGSYKKPKMIISVDSIPRTASGKVMKKKIREEFWKGRDRKV